MIIFNLKIHSTHFILLLFTYLCLPVLAKYMEDYNRGSPMSESLYEETRGNLVNPVNDWLPLIPKISASVSGEVLQFTVDETFLCRFPLCAAKTRIILNKSNGQFTSATVYDSIAAHLRSNHVGRTKQQVNDFLNGRPTELPAQLDEEKIKELPWLDCFYFNDPIIYNQQKQIILENFSPWTKVQEYQKELGGNPNETITTMTVTLYECRYGQCKAKLCTEDWNCSKNGFMSSQLRLSVESHASHVGRSKSGLLAHIKGVCLM